MRLLILAVLAASISACGDNPAVTGAQGGTSFFSGMNISETLNNTTRWNLRAPVAGIRDKDGRMTFSQPVLTLYDEDKVSTVITSRSGTLDTPASSAVLTDDVLVNARKDGMSLRTEKLFYSSAKGKIWTDEKVRFLRGKTLINGRGFTANPDLSEIEIYHQETQISGK